MSVLVVSVPAVPGEEGDGDVCTCHHEGLEEEEEEEEELGVGATCPAGQICTCEDKYEEYEADEGAGCDSDPFCTCGSVAAAAVVAPVAVTEAALLAPAAVVVEI